MSLWGELREKAAERCVVYGIHLMNMSSISWNTLAVSLQGIWTFLFIHFTTAAGEDLRCGHFLALLMCNVSCSDTVANKGLFRLPLLRIRLSTSHTP